MSAIIRSTIVDRCQSLTYLSDGSTAGFVIMARPLQSDKYITFLKFFRPVGFSVTKTSVIITVTIPYGFRHRLIKYLLSVGRIANAYSISMLF